MFGLARAVGVRTVLVAEKSAAVERHGEHSPDLGEIPHKLLDQLAQNRQALVVLARAEGFLGVLPLAHAANRVRVLAVQILAKLRRERRQREPSEHVQMSITAHAA